MTGGARIAGVVAMLALVAAVVRAEDGLTLYVDAGASFPAAPPEFPELWDTGWTAGAGVGLRVSAAWEVVTAAHYLRYGADADRMIEELLLAGPGGVLDIAAIDGRDMSSLSLLVETRFHGRDAGADWRPYLTFGAGFFHASTSDATVTPADPGVEPVVVLGDSDGALAASIGAGVLLRLTASLSFVFDSTYLIGFTEQSSTEALPLRIGLAFE